MPQLSIAPGSTGVTVQVRILDSTSATGAGKTGLAYDTASLTAYYNRERGASTQIALATLAAANSAWSSGGFKEIDATNKPGEYRLDLPDAVLAAGSRFATVTLRGASNMADCVLMIDLKNESSVVAITDGIITAAKFAANALDAVWSTSARTLTSFGTLVADIWANATRTLTAISDSSGITTLLSRILGTIAAGTHNPQSGDAYARIGAAGAGLTALGDARLANLDAAVSSRSTYAGADTAGTTTLLARIASAITITGGKVDVNDKTGFGLSSAALAAIVTAVLDEDILVHDGTSTFGKAILDILADTGELQMEWANGGRLDLILDAVATASALAGAQSILDKVNGLIESAGSYNRYKATALEQAPSGGSGSAPTAGEVADAVWDEALSGHATAGTAGYLLTSAGSGGISPELVAMIEETYAGVTALQGVSITLASPMGSGGTISILYGYDYYAADGTVPTWNGTNWPNLTGAALSVVDFTTRASLGGTVTGTSVGGSTQTVKWEIPDETFDTHGSGKYILEAVLQGGHKVPLAVGDILTR